MSGTAIANYFASLQVKVDRSSIRQVDLTLKQIEKRLDAFSKLSNKKLQQAFKGFELPALKVKKFTFDTLSLQRNAQMELNKVGRLLELPIGRVRFDEAKIGKQFQSVFQRQANKASINIKTVAGTAGGGNVYLPHLRPNGITQAISQYGHPAHMNIPGMNSFAGMGRFGLPMGAGLGAGALAGTGVGVVAGGVVAAQQGSVALGNDQAQKENMRAQLDVASGQTTRAGKDAQNKRFFDLANMTGTKASELITPYAQMMKTLNAMGLNTEKSFDLYKDMSLYAKGTGASGEQQGRAAYAIGQIYGKGFVAREDLQLQLSDALPSFKKYLMQVFEKETGKKGGEAFDKALTNKQITTTMMEQAFKLAAASNMKNVQQYSNTVLGEQARLENMKLEEQMARTLSDDVIPGMRNYTKAQGELYKAMEPMRNQFYDLSAGILNFSASMLRASTPFVKTVGDLGTPTIPKIASATSGNRPWWDTSGGGAGPMSSERYGMFANRDKGIGPATQAGVDRFKSLSESFKPKLGPLPMESKESALQSIREGINQRITNNNATANITVNNTFNGVDPGEAERNMVEVSKRVWRDSFKATLTESLQNYPQKE